MSKIKVTTRPDKVYVWAMNNWRTLNIADFILNWLIHINEQMILHARLVYMPKVMVTILLGRLYVSPTSWPCTMHNWRTLQLPWWAISPINHMFIVLVLYVRTCLHFYVLLGLTLVSAPHLARSYHHLFPLDQFREIPTAQMGSNV